MADLNDQIKELEMRLDRLVRTQIGFQAEITAIRAELKILGQQGPSRPSGLKRSEDRIETPAQWYGVQL